VLQLEVLIGKLGSIDALTWKISTELDDKISQIKLVNITDRESMETGSMN